MKSESQSSRMTHLTFLTTRFLILVFAYSEGSFC